MGWDWTFVGEEVVGIAGGIIIGSWVATSMLETVLLRVLSHPTARKLASAVEKVAGGAGGLGDFLKQLFGGNG